jgi:hypothetical protein
MPGIIPNGLACRERNPTNKERPRNNPINILTGKSTYTKRHGKRIGMLKKETRSMGKKKEQRVARYT